MLASARVQAAIDILDAVVASARDGGAAADTLIQRYFASRRYAGSKDRRAVRELVYAVIRSVRDVPESGRAGLIGHARANDPALLDAFGGGPHAPAALIDGEAGAALGFAPAWLRARLVGRFGNETDQELRALLDRAPLELRANRLKTSRDALLADFPGALPLELAPDALRLAAAIDVEASDAFRDGRVEVQDAGSQCVALAAAATPGMTVVDLCAGAGGKTLALAAAMANDGRLIAADTDRGRLSRLPPRAERAGAGIIETRLLDPHKESAALADLANAADVVLIDAPCSGTGTWRRNPEARWRLSPARLARLIAEQRRLLALGAALVKPGGALVYAVCSLLPEEGEGAFEAWLSSAVNWTAGPQRVLTPRRDGCDGFFIGRATRLC